MTTLTVGITLRRLTALFTLFILTLGLHASAAERARDLGIGFLGLPGEHNAITDVAGVEVGHTTLISGSGALARGAGPVRTGVTVIHPRGKASTEPVFGGWFTLNASGEMTGTTWLEERGVIDGPIGITNTHSVQQPGGLGGASGGQREFVPVLSRAALAIGVAGLFMETHEDPDNAPSDGPNMVALHEMEALLKRLQGFDALAKS